jgi:hypothetical protein
MGEPHRDSSVTRPRTPDIDQFTAFEIIGRIMPAASAVKCFTLKASFAMALKGLAAVAASAHAALCAGRDPFSFTMSITAPVNDAVMARFEIIPIDNDAVIIAGTPVMGTEPAFARIQAAVAAYFHSVEQAH